MGGFSAAERARRLLAERPFADVGLVSFSAGVCGLAQASDADKLVRLADGALYWAKVHGRDATYLYSPDVVEELSAAERAQRLARHQALSGLRALAARSTRRTRSRSAPPSAWPTWPSAWRG
jgi:predicted signal transduction protein with EAL and GGDEF domain